MAVMMTEKEKVVLKEIEEYFGCGLERRESHLLSHEYHLPTGGVVEFSLQGKIHGYGVSGAGDNGLYIFTGEYSEAGIYYNEGCDYLISEDTDNLGIEDIFNLKEHEYGVLKLKYGIERWQLFVPKSMVDVVRPVFYNRDN